MEPQNNPPHGNNGLVLALSGGGAAGLAHIGVIQVLAENDIPVRAVVGTSIGAEIGAFMASGMPVDELVSLATAFDWKQTLQLFMPDLPTGGLVSGKKIMDFLNTKLGKRHIENLHIGYAAITTDLETGEQVVLDCGGLVDAVRASISLPGLIAPHCIGSRWLVDGSVLNPVPFDVARERFGGPVVAVAVHSAARRQVRHPRQPRSTHVNRGPDNCRFASGNFYGNPGWRAREGSRSGWKHSLRITKRHRIRNNGGQHAGCWIRCWISPRRRLCV